MKNESAKAYFASELKKAGEEIFDDYWANFGKIVILVDGKRKKLSSFEEYLQYRGLPMNLNNPKAVKRKAR